MARCTIVVPCYNERRRLDLGTFRAFAADQAGTDFLFVDDGSTDGTGELLDALAADRPDRFLSLRMERNVGKAEAVRRGVLLATGLGADYVGFWDADLATPLDELPGFVAHLEAHPGVWMVFGSRVRMLGRSIDRKASRHCLGRLFATAVSLLFGIPVYDTQCGAKVFRAMPAVRRLFERPFRSRWIFDVELLARCLADRPSAAGERIHEIPLGRWTDVEGSKVTAGDFARSLVELWTIRRAWGRAGQGGALAADRRPVERPHLRPAPAAAPLVASGHDYP